MISYNLTWHDKRSKRKFIDVLFRALGSYYEEFVDETYEIPYSYSERTFVGHLAQAACQSGYYSIQDYNVTAREAEKHKQSHYIPDIHIWIPQKDKKTDTCVFEVKTDYPIPIDKDKILYKDLVNYFLKEANDQLDRQAYIEARNRCALLVTPIQCAPTKWERIAKTPRIYHRIVNKLVQDLIPVTKEAGANFVWTYLLDYERIHSLSWKDNGKRYLPWVGIICSGNIKQYTIK